ncbi:hypothetical protein ACP70R_001795 [Stipagrostis hirtigluma subsp. patula]
MYSGTTKYDKYEAELERVLQDPYAEPVSLPLEFLEAITDGFSNEQEIARGGFGVVYKGVLGSGNVIAVKKNYDMKLLDDTQYEKELRHLMGFIHHENIVQLIGFCAESRWETRPEITGSHILVEARTRLLCFEYLGNGSLADYVSCEPFDFGWDRRYGVIQGICKGLYFLHEECSILHRDLKPQNILMDDDMVPKITDFGLSRHWNERKSKTFTQNFTGTVGYMAPEFIFHGEISPEADIFSLGVIIIEIITGEKRNPHRILPEYSRLLNEDNSLQSTEKSLQQFTEKEVGRWRKIFETSGTDATLQEVYTQEVKQLIEIALKCVDPERKKRSNAWEVLQLFSKLNGHRGLCDSNGESNQQVRELLSVQPSDLLFPSDEPHKLCRTVCSLHLKNNTNAHVAFKLVAKTLAEHFVFPPRGAVPPSCSYTLAVTMRNQQRPQLGSDGFFTLESTIASIHGLHHLGGRAAADYLDRFFTKAKEKGRQVQQIKVRPVYEQTKVPGISSEGSHIKYKITIIRPDWAMGYDSLLYMNIDVHPTEPWILMSNYDKSAPIGILDYDTQEPMCFFAAGMPKDVSPLSMRNDGRIEEHGTAKFIPRKKWIVVGCYSGRIKVYSYMIVRNLKESRSFLASEIKSFKAHNSGRMLLDVHPTEPYLLSASSGDRSLWSAAGMIKLWNWDKGWDCIRTFENQYGGAYHVKFNPMDANSFLAISDDGGDVQVYNIGSPYCESILPGARAIWDCDSITCVETLKGHTSYVRSTSSHSELPILFTGSEDGTIRLWNSGTFRVRGNTRLWARISKGDSMFEGIKKDCDHTQTWISNY